MIQCESCPAVATSGREWLGAFAAAGGLDGLIATLSSHADASLVTKENLEIRLLGMSIIKAFMNNQTGMDALVESSGGIQMIVQQLCPNIESSDGNLSELADKLTEASLEKLSVLCWYLGYDTVLEAFEEFPEVGSNRSNSKLLLIVCILRKALLYDWL